MLCIVTLKLDGRLFNSIEYSYYRMKYGDGA